MFREVLSSIADDVIHPTNILGNRWKAEQSAYILFNFSAHSVVAHGLAWAARVYASRINSLRPIAT